MSADNRTFCPKCSQNFKSKRDKQLECAQRQYGKISRDQYDRLIAAAMEIKQEPCMATLREDFDQGINEGIYEVTYSCSCSNCGFSWKYHHEEDVLKGNKNHG